jgi:N-acetylglucosaminyl-diphospho-decaprenol L-rhamnosyltransferase
MSPSIDVVIPVHDGWSLTESCLCHLRQQTLAHRAIVVDNGSTDGTPERLREMHADVQVIELAANLGFPVACNRGAAAGKSDIVVLLNNDVDCRPDFLEQLVAPFERDETLGSVAALLLAPGEERVESVGLAVDSTLAGYPRLRGAPANAAGASRPVLVGPSGAGGAYRREAWEEVGGLDEGVLFYGEDLDLAVRLRVAGWSALAAPEAVAVHVGSATAGTRSPWQRYQGGFARGYFLRRYGVFRSRAALRALSTEAIAVTGDSLIFSRDFAALHGRLDGWRAAAGLPPHQRPPGEVVDHEITFLESVRLRRRVYSCM